MDSPKKVTVFASILPTLALFFLSAVISYVDAYAAIAVALIGCTWAFYSNSVQFSVSIKNRQYFQAVFCYIYLMTFLALLFTFVQVAAYGKSMGYLKYGGCDGDTSFESLTSNEISQLPSFVSFDKTKQMYFNIVTLTTLGYGDICPQGDIMRWIVAVEVLLGMAVNVLFVAIVLRENSLPASR